MTKIILKFEAWLIDQQGREDIIGDLAHVLSMQNSEQTPSKRKSDEHKKWADIVIKIPESGLIAVFNEAWQEFLLEKAATTESLE
ncbi:MAG: hypothetical protein IAF02_23700 [Anaerolineae bacterium]|nr:hypothetical protein [Anaerolineae bacterium]